MLACILRLVCGPDHIFHRRISAIRQSRRNCPENIRGISYIRVRFHPIFLVEARLALSPRLVANEIGYRRQTRMLRTHDFRRFQPASLGVEPGGAHMFPVCEALDYESNAILRAIPEEDTMRLLRSARKVHLEAGRVVYGAGDTLSFVYFPTTCVVSHSYTTREGVSTSMALVGNDGVIGLPLLLGAQCAPHSAVLQIGGYALKVAASVVQAEFARSALLRQVLLLYMHAFISQLGQTAACNRLHPLEQRLCRWLVLCHDRVGGDEMLMTQESMAGMVGGRRESVTLAAGHLQDLGIIRSTRGRIQILNRDALEALACECYAALADDTQQSHDYFNVARRMRSPEDLGLSV